MNNKCFQITWTEYYQDGEREGWYYSNQDTEDMALYEWQGLIGEWVNTKDTVKIEPFIEPNILSKYLEIHMPDGYTYKIRVKYIALDKADNGEDNSYKDRLLNEVVPLFKGSILEVINYAQNNMKWDLIKEFARKEKRVTDEIMQTSWERFPCMVK